MVRARGRVPLQPIENRRTRRTTFANRSKGLKNKLDEFTTLCDVQACFICYGHDGEVVTWPQDDTKTRELIERNRAMGDKRREIGMVDIYHDKIRKLQRELAQARRKNAESLYPLSDARLDQLTVEGCRNFRNLLHDKLEKVGQQIESTKTVHGFHDHRQPGNCVFPEPATPLEASHGFGGYYQPTPMEPSNYFEYYQATPIQLLPSPLPSFGFQAYMPGQLSHDQYIIPSNTIYSAMEVSNQSGPTPEESDYTSNWIPRQSDPTSQTTHEFQPQMPTMQNQAFVNLIMNNGLFTTKW